jgi:CRP-like cAMP-binding protein
MLERSTIQKRPDPPNPPSAGAGPNGTVLLYEAHPHLSGVPDIFANLSADDVSRIIAAGKKVDFEAGDHLFRQGEPHEGIFILRAGTVRSYYVSPAGREITLANWTPGNFVGGPEIFGGGVHVWSGIATKSGHAIFLPGSAVRTLMAEVPNFAVGLVHGLAFKGKCYSALLQMLGTRSVVERLALVILNLTERQEIEDGYCIVVTRPVSHEELAGLVGATRQWISMTLDRFRKRGLIDVRNRRLVVLRPAELQTISRGA